LLPRLNALFSWRAHNICGDWQQFCFAAGHRSARADDGDQKRVSWSSKEFLTLRLSCCIFPGATPAAAEFF
jgi:hypothetical protein